MGLRGLFIDLDGTLADSRPIMRRAYETFLNEHGRSGTDEEFDRLEGPTLAEIVRGLKATHRLGDPKDVLYEQYQAIVERAYTDEVRLHDGAVELLSLASAHGLRCTLVTSGHRRVVEAFLRARGLRGSFEVIVTGDDVVAGKPDPAIYRLALDRAAVSPEDAVAVEDSDAGEASARGAGLRVWRVGNGLTGVIAALRREVAGG